MKVLLIHNKYNSRLIGGEDIAFEQECINLKRKLGDNLVVYVVSNDKISFTQLVFSFFFSRVHYENIRNIIESESVDLVHIHNFFPQLTYSVFKAVKDSGKKIIHTIHSYRNWCIDGTFYRDGYGFCEICSKKKYPWMSIYYRCYKKSILLSFFYQINTWYNTFNRLYEKIDYFFALTQDQARRLENLGINENKIFIKPNFIDFQYNSKIDLNDRSGYIFVGKIVESKGIHFLLNIWKTLPKEYVLHIIGEGDDFVVTTKKYQANNIKFYGKIQRNDALQMIKKSKFLIQPSLLYETFGLTILEAFSFGVPVLGLNIGTRAEFIINNYNGFVSNKNEFRNTIIDTLNINNYKSLSDGASETFKKYSPDIILEGQIAFYEDCMN
jgi:glycosyltransferase involved in cell wall biosynthesis